MDTAQLLERIHKYNGTYEDFTDIMRHVTFWHRWRLGDILHGWTTACLYNFMMQDEFDTDLEYVKPQIIAYMQELIAEEYNRENRGTGPLYKYLKIAYPNIDIDLEISPV